MSSHPGHLESIREKIRANAPDPIDALRRLGRIDDAFSAKDKSWNDLDEDALLIISLACTHAPYLATLIARDEERVSRVAASDFLRRSKAHSTMMDELNQQCRDVVDDDDLKRRLRQFRGDEITRLGVRELELGTAAEVGVELASLASVCLDVAIEFHLKELSAQYGPPIEMVDDDNSRPATLTVFGMGKLGGDELNFSSDIDLIYVYSSDDGCAGELSLHEFFSKLCNRVTSALGEVTEEDTVFRVDLRLRPEGSQGAIANSFASTERYYENFGRAWERQAWLKAQPIAGDLNLGHEFIETLRPFIYSKSISPNIIDDVATLNQKIKGEIKYNGIETGFDVKNGIGGIREIEFFVQALQLIHAGHNPSIRSRNTGTALEQLLFAGLITELERQSLVDAYRFLRHVEHVIQLEAGRQTQKLPSDSEQFKVLAKRLGFSDSAAMQEILEKHTRLVSESFKTLGDESSGPSTEVTNLLSKELSDDEHIHCLSNLNFALPEQAHSLIKRAQNLPMTPLSPSAYGAARNIAPALIEAIISSPDPDIALRHTIDLMIRRRSWSEIWRLMTENPSVLQLVISVFGTSEFLSKIIVKHPEQFNSLLTKGRGGPQVPKERLKRALHRRLEQVEDGNEEYFWNTLALFKTNQTLRIGLSDISGVLSSEEVCTELSNLAELCLASALNWAQQTIKDRYGDPIAVDGSLCRLTVMALGKLGGSELGYASDLDLIFIYDQDGSSNGVKSVDVTTYMSRVAQVLMRGLAALHPAGRLYEIDTRLRPSGTKGLLVSSIAGWNRYHQNEARLWERQALTKIRFVAGDADLGEVVKNSADHFVYGHTNHDTSISLIRKTIREMRASIEHESVKEQHTHDLKAGPGGIIDIEFAAQFLQIAYGQAHPSLRTPSTLKALDAAVDANVLTSDLASIFVDGYHFLRQLEHRVRIVYDQPSQSLPSDQRELDKLAKRLKYSNGNKLLQDFDRWTTVIRGAFDQLLHE